VAGPLSCFAFPGFIFGSTGCDLSRFNVLRSCTRFRRYRGCRLPFSCFALSNTFSAVRRASGPVFHILRTRTHFWRYRERRIPFSFFAPLDSFSAVPRAFVPVFMFCAPGLIFGGPECVRSRFYFLPARTYFRRYLGRRVPFSAVPRASAVSRASGPDFTYCPPGIFSGGTEGVGYRFHILRSQTCLRLYRTHFRKYRGRRLPFSFFAFQDLFSAVPRASTPVFLFCAPDSFSAVRRASDLVFMFCSPGLVFPRFRGRQVPFSCFAPRTHFRRY
jgi:hypothetical protein